MTVSSDGVEREDSAGTASGRPRYEGDHLYVPASGPEGRQVRVIVKPCRNDPATLPDPASDDISARLALTPRYLALPE